MAWSIKVTGIEFSLGYHVGWLRSEEIIDHTTILRGLIEASSMTGNKELIQSTIMGEISATALLPIHTCGESAKLLVRRPVVPIAPGAKKALPEWFTLPAIKTLLNFVEKCIDKQGSPFLSKLFGRSIVYECRERTTHETIDSVMLKTIINNYIVCADDSDCREVCIKKERYYERIVMNNSRIDRVTGAADVYRVDGIRAKSPFWVALASHSESLLEQATEMLKVLGDIGVGGYKSRGFGRFRLMEIKISERDEEVLRSNTSWRKGYAYLLGSYPPYAGQYTGINPELTYGTQRILEGISGGPYNNYWLPLLRLLDIGSLAYFSSHTNRPFLVITLLRLEGMNYEPVIVFNPVTLHG
jgi:hypothetical protein